MADHGRQRPLPFRVPLEGAPLNRAPPTRIPLVAPLPVRDQATAPADEANARLVNAAAQQRAGET